MSDFHPIYDTRLLDLDIAVFDLETSGLHSSKDAIIQIASVLMNSGEFSAEWSTYVDPGEDHRPISSFITQFTGIKDTDLDGAPDLEAMMKTFDAFIETRIVAGHNVASFDLKFIRRAENRTGIDVQSDYYIDTLRLMQRLHPELPSKKLGACGEYYGIGFDEDELHDALADTRLCAQVMLKQFEELDDKGHHTFSDMLEFVT